MDLPGGVNLFMGFGFDEDGPSGLDWEGFPSAVAVLPEVMVVRAGGRSSLTVAIRPGSDGRLLLGLLSALRAPGIPTTGATWWRRQSHQSAPDCSRR
jgi:hypothetical protein